MRRSGAFILPSTVEAWGVVIHEATCAGLPILASRACGAVANLVRDGYNGFSFPLEDTKTLAVLMQHISDSEAAKGMGHNSLRMSYQFDPKLWAKNLIEDIPFYLTGHPLVANKD
jgi:glycosyltransferase involved in cell wall biosynthesis